MDKYNDSGDINYMTRLKKAWEKTVKAKLEVRDPLSGIYCVYSMYWHSERSKRGNAGSCFTGRRQDVYTSRISNRKRTPRVGS